MSISIEDRIHLIQAQDLYWPFEGTPRWKSKPRLGYVKESAVDPFPCYPHELGVVMYHARVVEELWPVPVPPSWYLLAYDDPSRVNGWAFPGEHYNRPGREDGDEPDLEPIIALVGKRIPIHPAMTAYLVGHEYGHVVDYFLQRQLGVTEKQFHADYARMRGVECREDYGGQRWHTNIAEIIANDFRVLVTELEQTFWPHPGILPPWQVPSARNFWKEHRPQ